MRRGSGSMGDRPRYQIRLSVIDNYSDDRWERAIGSDEFPIFSERFVGDMKLGFVVPSHGETPFTETVKVLKERQFRKEYLMEAARMLARSLADYIEDSEGWHGERRQELIKEQRKKR